MSDNLKVAKECGGIRSTNLYRTQTIKPVCGVLLSDEQLEAYTSRILASQQAAHEAEIARLKEDEFSESKDWKESDIAGRIDWLMSRVKSFRKDIALLTEQLAEAEQRGAVKALEDAAKEMQHRRFELPSEASDELLEMVGRINATSKKAG